MTRREFTIKIVSLLQEMIDVGENPIIDYVLRSTEEQQRLFKAGKTKCDGIEKRSRHQSARAMDIYLVKVTENSIKTEYVWNLEKAIYWHKIWTEKYGGREMIDWDRGHFES